MTARSVFKWAGLATLTLLIIAIVAVVIIVHTNRFHRFVLAEVIRQTEATIGGRLTIGAMAMNWRHLEFDFYDIEFHGNEGYSQPALFVSEHLRVGLKIISLLHRQVDLNDIVLDQPVAHINVDAAGHSKLPSEHRTSGASNEAVLIDIFDLAVQHLEINEGQFYFNDRQIPLSVELRSLRTQIHFDRTADEYRGMLAYEDGRITSENFKPIPHGLQTNFSADRGGISFDRVQVATKQSHITAHAKWDGYAEPHITGTYDAAINTNEVSDITRVDSIPVGDVAMAGTFTYQQSSKGSWLDDVYVDGTASSQQIKLSLGREVATANSIRAQYRLQNGDLTVNNIAANLLGGSVVGNYEMLHIPGNSTTKVQASLQNVSLQELNYAAGARDLKNVRLAGFVSGTVGASWASRVQDGIARMHLVIRNSNGHDAGGSAIPLNGLIDVNYDGARGVASFGRSYLNTGNTTITASGVLSRNSQLQTEINASDLQEVVALANTLGLLPEGRQNFLPSDLRGSARFEGQIQGSVKDPRIVGHLDANQFDLQNTHWNSLHLNLDLASSEVTFQNGVLEDIKKGQIAFSGSASLQDWSFRRSGPISLQVQAKQTAIADVQQFLKSNYPVDGFLGANISIQGSADNPLGQGSIQVSQATAWNQPINNLSVDFKADENSVHSNGKLTAGGGTVNGELTYLPKTQSYDVTLNSSEIKLDQLQAAPVRALAVSGNLSLSASGHGTLSDPQVSANLHISQLRVRNQLFSDTAAQLNVSNQRANFSFNTKADQGIIQASGSIGLNGDYPVTASLDVRAIPVAAVLAGYLHANPKIQGTAELHADLKGPLKNPAELVAQVEIPQLDLGYQSTEPATNMTTHLALARTLRINYQNGLATIEDGELKGSGTDFFLKGTIPLKSAVPMNVSAIGTVDLSIIHSFAPDISSSGRIELNVSAKGDLSHPAIQGQVHVVNGTLSSEDIPVGFEGINGLLQITGNRIEVTQFAGAAGGGTISAHGFMSYGEPSNFNLGLDLKSVRLRYPQGVRSILGGSLALNGTAQDSALTGRVLVDRLSFTQQFDLANFLGQFSSNIPSESPSQVERNMKLNISLNTAQDLDLSNNKLSIGGAANLTLRGTLDDPVILGRTTLTSGEIFFMGKRYEIQGGTIEFANPVQSVPVLNLNVTTTVQQYTITLNFVGPPDRLRTNYSSDPPLPPADIINMIAFGKTFEQAATSPSTPATVGAESVLAQGAAGQLSNKIESVTGITQLTIDPLAGNSQTNTGSVVAIQQRVTGNILLTFSSDVTSTQNQAVQVQDKVKKNLSISVLRDAYGGYAADLHVHKNF